VWGWGGGWGAGAGGLTKGLPRSALSGQQVSGMMAGTIPFGGNAPRATAYATNTPIGN
jgi:hypothetical protein